MSRISRRAARLPVIVRRWARLSVTVLVAIAAPAMAAEHTVVPITRSALESVSAAPTKTDPVKAGLATDGTSAQPLVYTLPPAELARARSLYYWRTALGFGFSFWGMLVLLAILNFGWAATLRDRVASRVRRRWLQGLCFLPLLLLLISLLHLPLAMIDQRVMLVYGQSVQGWRGWFLDWGKAVLLDLLVGTLVLSVALAIIRASSRRWWLWIWLLSLPLQLFAIFILPVFVDPLFNHFELLQKSDPALVLELERVVAKAGVNIPPSRMFLMDASRKVTGSNAYVTGFGASKRVVVWDTTIKRLPQDEILVIFAHELGHYVLNHIRRGLLIAAALSFFLLWLGFYSALFLVRRYGARWRIASIEDWAAAAVLLLVFSILSFLAEPLGNSISRIQEHQADVFGEEAVHGIVADPEKSAAESFEQLGAQYLEYPNPNRFVVFWTYSHPSTAARMAFALHYDPWQPGKHPRYFKRNEKAGSPVS